MAANACAHLLRGAGLRVGQESAHRPPVPSLLLSEAALALMRDLFARPDLFADAPRVRRRLVAWGPRFGRGKLKRNAYSARVSSMRCSISPKSAKPSRYR